MALPLRNYLLGKIGPDQVPCALVAADDLDDAQEALVSLLGRDTHPGELYAQAAEQLGVDRVVSVFCPQGQTLAGLLEFSGPDRLHAKGALADQTRADLAAEDFTIEGLPAGG